MKITCVDFETANKSSASPCSVGITTIENLCIKESRGWLIKLHPSRNWFNDKNISIHGITPDMVEQSPEFNEVFKEMFPYIENSLLVAHYAIFDMSVLKHTLQLYGLEIPNIQYTCTRNIARKVWSLRSYRLNEVCNYLNYSFNHHEATSDSKACAHILISAMKKIGVYSPIELLEKIELQPQNLIGKHISQFNFD